MEKKEKGKTGHVLVIPFHAQGHINPMPQFSKRLAYKGLKLTLVYYTPVEPDPKSTQALAGSVNIETISATINEVTIDNYLKRYQVIVKQGLEELIHKHKTTGDPISFLVYDASLSWILDIAKQLGLNGAPFITQSCAVTAIYYNVREGLLKTPVEGPNVLIDGLLPLGTCDLPSMVSDSNSYQSLLTPLLEQFSNFDKVDCIFLNTVNSFEEEAVKWMARQWPIKTIGPTIPSMYLDKWLKDNNDYGLNLFKPNIDECMKWLDTKENGSVVYVAFGSVAFLGQEPMKELACGLTRSEKMHA